MRLLNVKTKRLELFYGFNIPPYAILSHMWGREGDEVLFKHIAGSSDDRHEGKRRKGYAKLSSACKQAIKDGWDYIWIDTCCIDKESSAELSEAINSMYQWYWESQVCYAYLEDVRSDKDIQDSGDTTFEMVPFKLSRWFDRGWTLQELIAPRVVIFYDRDWVDIGTKASLQDVISSRTNIRVEMITGYDPRKTSVAERMSWAAYRETTRAEDIAYCLMGIFGVHMPLLYGEGKRAFMRLQEEIMKLYDDHSLFAWLAHTEANVTRGLLADYPSEFAALKGRVIECGDKGAYAGLGYSMSNNGLQIALPLLPIDHELNHVVDIPPADRQKTFKAILNCTIRRIDGHKEPTRWIFICLERVKEGHYVRRYPGSPQFTHINPRELKLTPLLVTQVETTSYRRRWTRKLIQAKILPTESGFTYQGRSLVKGYEYSSDYDVILDSKAILIFSRHGRHFGVAIGSDNGIPWLDIIQEIDPLCVTERGQKVISKIKSTYEEGGSRYNVVARHQDRVSVNISESWLVVASVRIVQSDRHKRGLRYYSVIQTTIDIRKG